MVEIRNKEIEEKETLRLIQQNRERVFIISIRDDKGFFSFPEKIPLELKLKDS